MKFTRFTKYFNSKYDRSIPAIYNEPTTKMVIGSISITISLLLFIAFISHLFNWKIDQDQAYSLLVDQPVENSSGGVGAFFSRFFMDEGFGILAFWIPLFGLLFGLKSFKENIAISYKDFFKAVFLITMLGTSSLTMILPSFELPLGGAFGITISDQLQLLFGKMGSWIVWLLFGFLYILLYYKINIIEILKVSSTKGTASPGNGGNEGEIEQNIPIEEKKNLEKKIDPEGFEIVDTADKIKAIQSEENTTEEELEGIELKVKKPEDNNLDIDDLIAQELKPEKTFEVEKELKTEVQTPEIIENAQEEGEGMSKEPRSQSESSSEHELMIEETVEEEIIEQKKAIGEFYDPTLDLSNYKFPKLDFLVDHGSGAAEVDKEELERNKDQIVKTLENYKIKIDKIKATIGPTVTLYEIVPAPGVRITKIKNLEDDIALSLAALGIRIIAPMPGKGTIGIEVPNKKPEVVSMKAVLGSEKFVNADMDLPLALGKTISNEIFVADLAKMPHLLIAGATGQGKSVGINSILVSLLYKKHPAQLKFVMVDPKKVELSIYRVIEKHFLAALPGEGEPIITDTKKVINTLNSLCIEMDERYELLKSASVRNLKEYNAKFQSRKLNPQNGHKYLPYIVLVIDEFADLIMTAGKEIETPIARLAQLARAVGIHLIIATQRPSVNIITGMIKANFPSRLAFRVMAKVDSRTILDAQGADQLIGRGDMLYSPGNEIVRLQCPFVDTPEVDEIVNFIGKQRGYPTVFELPEYTGEDEDGPSKDFDATTRDALFDDAARIVVGMQSGSTSMLQRRLKLGYNRAGRLMDELEGAGIVGAQQGSKPREVLVSSEYELEEKLEQLNNG